MLPTFTLAEFLEMISRYNLTFWPLQIVAFILGIFVVLLAIWNGTHSGRIVSAILVFYWLWVGLVFNLLYFSPIFPMAITFVFLFVLQAVILIFAGVFKGTLSFKFKMDLYGIMGVILVIYSMVGYPAIEYLLGRGYPSLLPFGLVPCPMTVFTLGVFLWSERKPKWNVISIPILYSLSGIIPISIGIVEDVGLVASGLIAIFLLLFWDYLKKDNKVFRSLMAG